MRSSKWHDETDRSDSNAENSAFSFSDPRDDGNMSSSNKAQHSIDALSSVDRGGDGDVEIQKKVRTYGTKVSFAHTDDAPT